MNSADVPSLLHFFEQAENLKNTLRSAHTSTGRHESTAEHTWRLCLMIVMFDQDLQDMDRLRLLHMAIIHDLAEAVCGDIPAVAQHEGDDKTHAESEAMQHLSAHLPPERREALLTLWEEYETGSSPEARFLKGLDKLETIVQHNQGRNPSDFDYAFNLHYGQQYMAAHPLLGTLREQLDAVTHRRAVAARAEHASADLR